MAEAGVGVVASGAVEAATDTGGWVAKKDVADQTVVVGEEAAATALAEAMATVAVATLAATNRQSRSLQL